MTVSQELRIGTELLGFRVEELVGRGGMSVIYRATDLRLKRQVALKLLSPELARDDGFRRRFLTESEVAGSLEHPHILPVYSAGEAASCCGSTRTAGRSSRRCVSRPSRAVAGFSIRVPSRPEREISGRR